VREIKMISTTEKSTENLKITKTQNSNPPFPPINLPDFFNRKLPETGIVVINGDAYLTRPPTYFEGNITVTGDLHFYGGYYDATIFCSGRIHVHQNTKISGAIYAMNGFYRENKGEISMDGRVWLPDYNHQKIPVKQATGNSDLSVIIFKNSYRQKKKIFSDKICTA
jgi:hypothetical protein